MSGSNVRVAIDVAGGDHAPAAVLDGIDGALAADPDLELLLTGPDEIVTPFSSARDRVTAVPTTEIIGMNEHPVSAVRTKRDSSIVVGCRLVKEGRAHAFFSAGSTGACMAAALLGVGRIPGVSRPAIATVIPTPGRATVLLDVGANADCKPEHLVQFAHMGAAYATAVLGVAYPRIALLNIGEEPAKGSQLAQDAYALMREQVSGFIGNVEGRDVPAGVADVIVTDGFTGNVALKLLEGTSKTLFDQLREVMTASVLTGVAASVLKPGLARLKERLDPEAYGGAPLLGIDGVCIVGHGSSGPRAVTSAIGVAARAVRAELTGMICEALDRD
jgi:glycerol-3-phosphate acyltransferase PlsX